MDGTGRGRDGGGGRGWKGLLVAIAKAGWQAAAVRLGAEMVIVLEGDAAVSGAGSRGGSGGPRCCAPCALRREGPPVGAVAAEVFGQGVHPCLG